MSKTFSIETLSIKTLLASSAIALGFMAVLGSAQAQQFKPSKPSVAASRQIEVLPGIGQQSETELRVSASAAGTEAPDANAADAAVAQQDTAPAEAEPQIIVSEETKRLNRQRYVERYEARRYAEPRYEERYAQPRYVEPRYVQPRHYVQREVYAQSYQPASSYGHVRRAAEHCAPRGY